MAVLYLLNTTPAQWDDAHCTSASTPFARFAGCRASTELLIGDAPLRAVRIRRWEVT